MDAHSAAPAVAGLMMPLLRLQHTCSGNGSFSNTILPLLRMLCTLQRLLVIALQGTCATLYPPVHAKDEPFTIDPAQLHSLLTVELPHGVYVSRGVCVRCLRTAVAEILVMAVAAVARSPEAVASNAVSQQLLHILSSETLVAAAADMVGDTGLPLRASNAISASLAVFREAAAATTVRKYASSCLFSFWCDSCVDTMLLLHDGPPVPQGPAIHLCCRATPHCVMAICAVHVAEVHNAVQECGSANYVCPATARS